MNPKLVDPDIAAEYRLAGYEVTQPRPRDGERERATEGHTDGGGGDATAAAELKPVDNGSEYANMVYHDRQNRSQGAVWGAAAIIAMSGGDRDGQEIEQPAPAQQRDQFAEMQPQRPNYADLQAERQAAQIADGVSRGDLREAGRELTDRQVQLMDADIYQDVTRESLQQQQQRSRTNDYAL